MKLVLLAFVAACSSASPPAPAPAPAPDPAPTPAPVPPVADAPGIGQKCGPNDLCARPAVCVSYYGIAGAKGPQFKTCEVKCDATTSCPDGKKCTTIADGPGSVCR
jgi:hypothetical protein